MLCATSRRVSRPTASSSPRRCRSGSPASSRRSTTPMCRSIPRGQTLRMEAPGRAAVAGHGRQAAGGRRANRGAADYPTPDAPCSRCARRVPWSGCCRGPYIPQGERLFAAARRACAASARTRSAVASTLPTVSVLQALRYPALDAASGQHRLAGGPTAATWRCRQHRARVRPSVLTEFIQFVAFVDAGTVWPRGEDRWRTRRSRDAGDRRAVSTPGGPIRLDIASNFTRRPPARRIATWRSDTRPRRSTA